MKYYRFTEHNDWEGESWNFYIPVEGNEKHIEKLKKHIDQDQYVLHENIFSQKEVDSFCEKINEYGYMPKHNKLSGKLKIPKDMNLDLLYKGGIQRLIEEQT